VATTGFYAPLGRFWEWNVTDSPGFVFAGTSIWSALGSGLASLAGFAVFHPVVTVAIGAAAAAGAAAIKRRAVPGDVDLWLWVASGVGAWLAGLRFFGHYWLQALPPIVLIAVPVVAGWVSRARIAAIVGVAVPAMTAWVLLFIPGSFHNRPDPDVLASYVRSHTTTADRVFVWGSYPEVLVAADRLPAGGLVHTDFVVGRSGGRNDPVKTLPSAVPGALDIMMRSLTGHRPQLILDTSTAPDLGYRNYPTSLLPDLERFIHDGYEQVDIVDGVTIWRRRTEG
ncbi:MAG: hypothetical protein QOH53_235, partial [Ilumatobacteraceae bacterium]